MKILNVHKTITAQQLKGLLDKKLNPLFHQQKQSDLNFLSEIKNGVVEISCPELYEGFLFGIEIKGPELHITRSEDYVDDVNSLALESVLNALFEQIAGDDGVTFVLEG